MEDENERKRMLPIFDKYINIYQKSAPYPYKEGQIYFATDIKKTFEDKGGIRASDMTTFYLGLLENGIDDIDNLERYAGNIINYFDSNNETFLYFVDGDLNLIRLNKSGRSVSKIIEQYAVSQYDVASAGVSPSDINEDDWESNPVAYNVGAGLIFKWKKTTTTFSDGEVLVEYLMTGNYARDGSPGAPGAPGTPGAPGAPGTPGAPGADGESITDTEIKYGTSSSGTNHNTVSDWYNTPPLVTEGNYLWTRVRFFNESGDDIGDPVYTSSRQGKDGDVGTDGTGIEILEYYQATNGTKPGAGEGTWILSTGVVPDPTEILTHLWKKTITNKIKSDGTFIETLSTVISLMGIFTKDGIDGYSTNYEEKFIRENTGTAPLKENGSWSDYSPSIHTINEDNRFLWIKRTLVKIDSDQNETYPNIEPIISLFARWGDRGLPGDGVTGSSITYAKSNQSLSPDGLEFKSTIEDLLLKGGDYLWTKTIISYSNSTTSEIYSVSYIAGEVDGTEVKYCIGNTPFDYPVSEGGWKDTVEELTFIQGHYLISRTYLLMSGTRVGSPVYSAEYIAKDGKLGPGPVFRGEWDETVKYYGTEDRIDIVYHNGQHWKAKKGDDNVQENRDEEPANGSEWWGPFGVEFDSIATGLIISRESVVKDIINVGEGLNPGVVISGKAGEKFNNTDPIGPYISIGQEGSINYGENGIFIGMQEEGGAGNNKAKLSLTGPGNYLNWSGDKLTIKGNIQTPDLIQVFGRLHEDSPEFDENGMSIKYIGTDRFSFFQEYGDSTKKTRIYFKIKFTRVVTEPEGKSWSDPVRYRDNMEITWDRVYPKLTNPEVLPGQYYGLTYLRKSDIGFVEHGNVVTYPLIEVKNYDSIRRVQNVVESTNIDTIELDIDDDEDGVYQKPPTIKSEDIIDSNLPLNIEGSLINNQVVIKGPQSFVIKVKSKGTIEKPQEHILQLTIGTQNAFMDSVLVNNSKKARIPFETYSLGESLWDLVTYLESQGGSSISGGGTTTIQELIEIVDLTE